MTAAAVATPPPAPELRTAPAHQFSRRRPRRPLRSAEPILSVVVVNFRQWENTVALVRQLDASDAMRSGLAEVVILDNDADSFLLRRCVRRWPGVSLRCFGRNRGFARAVNEGCRRARGQWLLLLNPDVRVPEEFLDRVLAAADRFAADRPRAGIVGFRLRHADGSRQGSTGPFPTLRSVITGLVRRRSRRRCRPLRGRHPRESPWVTGCCLLARRDCWREIGGFDEDFFLYYEDVDLCRRARAADWSVWYEPALKVTHLSPLHTRPVPPPLRLMTRHALLTYAAKHWPRWQFQVLGRLVAADARVRGWLSAARGDSAGAAHCRRLAELAGDLLRGRGVRARHRLLTSARALNAAPDRSR
jgi:N-acetylglucosaminyl-diphospho-decaprenol L-rhamnosyltransferase